MRLIFVILSAGLFVSSLVLWISSLGKTCVVAHYGIADIRALNGELYLRGPRLLDTKASEVVRSFAGFGFLNARNAWIITIPLWAVTVGAGVAYLLSLMLRRHSTAAHCPHCSYNLTGNTSGVCPECGMKTPTESLPNT